MSAVAVKVGRSSAISAPASFSVSSQHLRSALKPNLSLPVKSSSIFAQAPLTVAWPLV